jgi:branched-chain amino acid transport system substrate-binding protein
MRVYPVLCALAGLVLAAGNSVAIGDSPPIKIGVISTYSGPLQAGKSYDAAFAAFIKEHGDTIAGRKIELIRRDDTGIAPEVARRLAQELIAQEHVDFLAGFGFTPNVMAVGPLTTQAKIPTLIANAATSNIIAGAPYMARFAFTNPQIVGALARWAARHRIKTALAIYQDYGPGIDAGTAFEKIFTSEGGKIVGDLRIPLNNVDYSSYVLRIRDAHPDAVFAMVNGNGGRPFMDAFTQAGLGKAGVKVLVSQDVVLDENLPGIGDQAIGIVSAGTYSPSHDSALNKQFVRDYKTFNDSDPDFLSVGAYDCLAAIYKVVAAQNGQIDPDRTMELLKHLKFESPRGPIEVDPQTRDLIENVYIRRTEKRNGRLVNVEIETIPMVRDPLEH